MEDNKKRLLDRLPRILALLFLPLCVLYNELLFSRVLHYRITAYTFGFSVAFGALMLAISMVHKNTRVQFVIQAIIVSLLAVIYNSQFIYYRIFKTLYIVRSIGGAQKALGFVDIWTGQIRDNAIRVLLFLVPAVLFFSLQRILIRKLEYSAKVPVAALLVSVIFGAGTAGAAFNDRSGSLSPRYLVLNSFVQEKSLDRFGLMTTMSLDVKYNVLNLRTEEDLDFNVGDIRIIEPAAGPGTAGSSDTTAAVTVPETTDSTPASETVPEETEPEVIVYEPNVMDIGFDPNESNETLLQMNTYFSQKEPSLKNEYTGMFEGKNLILLTAEGFSKYAIDPVLTPTLYKLSTEGFVFRNFYTPIWGVSTSDGEYVATTGLLPKAGVWSYTKIAGNYMPFAFGNQFSDLGYVTKAYHNHTYTYYNRDQSYPTMGYDYKGVGNGLDVKVTWPESDLEMMQLTAPEYVNSSPFHIYYMTVSGHLEYNFGGNYISKKNKDLVADLTCSDHVKAYYACQMELDFALENLLAQLEAAGQLENTVIALSADHYPYGLTPEEFDELAGHELENTFEMYESVFILWSGDMETPVPVDKYCSSVDIAPTLSNLFGLTYDSRLYTGTDILSTKSPVVYFQDRSFITDKIMYNANSGEVYKLTDEEITDEYIKNSIQSVNDAFKYAAKIIEEDYYQYLWKE